MTNTCNLEGFQSISKSKISSLVKVYYKVSLHFSPKKPLTNFRKITNKYKKFILLIQIIVNQTTFEKDLNVRIYTL